MKMKKWRHLKSPEKRGRISSRHRRCLDEIQVVDHELLFAFSVSAPGETDFKSSVSKRHDPETAPTAGFHICRKAAVADGKQP